MKGISKWVETAIRPVPERSHILKTWPTKAGPPLPPVMFFPLSRDTRTDLGEERVDSAVEERVTAERGGGRKRGREIAEGSWGEDEGRGGGGWGLKREMKFEAVEWRKVERWLWWWLLRRRCGEDGWAMHRIWVFG